MKQNRFSTVFSVIMIVLALAVIAAPWLIKSVVHEKSQSEDEGIIEKRTLSEFPSEYSNEWFSKFESFYSDHSPARGQLIELKTNTALKYNSFYRQKINPVLTRVLVKEPAPASEAPGTAGGEVTPQPTVDLSLIIGLDTPEPTDEPTQEPTQEPTAVPATDTPTPLPPTDVPATETPGPTAEPTATPSDNSSPEPTEVPAATPTPAPTPTPTPAPTPHVHTFDSGKITLYPGCTREGTKLYTCKVCGETKTETLPKTEHQFIVVKSSTADYDNYGYKLKKCNVCGTYSLDDLVPKEVDGSYLAPEYAGGAIFGRRDWLFYSGNSSEDYYRGTNLFSIEEMEAWKNKFEQLNAVCREKGIELVVMAAPNKEQMYPEYMPTYQIASAQKRQDIFLDYMKANSSVRYLYPKAELTTTKIFYDVFYKQDTHWNALGGFTGAMAVYRALGLQSMNVFELDVTETKRKGGDLSSFSGYTSEYRDWKINYKTNIEAEAEYFENHVTSSPTELSRFTAKDATYKDKKLVVIGDSFRHALSGVMSKDFGVSVFAHRNELPYETPVVMEALRGLGKGDVLLLMAVERLDGTLYDSADRLIAILTR